MPKSWGGQVTINYYYLRKGESVWMENIGSFLMQ